MALSQTLGGNSRLGRLVGPALDKIIKNAAWRKHSKLVQQCKAVLDKLATLSDSETASPNAFESCLFNNQFCFSSSDAEFILQPLLMACETGYIKVVEPALGCIQKLVMHSHLRGEVDNSNDGNPILLEIMESVCKCFDLGDDNIELGVLKTLLSMVTSVSMQIHGDCLLQIVRTCYNIFLGCENIVNQATAKASLIQMLAIVFHRMEADSSTVPVQPIVVADLMEPAEKSATDLNMLQFVQNFISKVMQDIEVVLNPAPSFKSMGHDGAFESTAAAVDGADAVDPLESADKDMLDAKYWEISIFQNTGRNSDFADGDTEKDGDLEVQISNKLRQDAFLVFRALCKLSMKTPSQEGSIDPLLMRGKVLSLELLNILLQNAGAVFQRSPRFLGAIKQYLCLSLVKNSALPLTNIFQLSCSIFMSLVSRFRAGLKDEIGVFFPMIVLRVLENVVQPNVQLKMIVLHFLDKLCVDSQILVDIFVNYDCDVESPNIFERMVNGLLKTAQGVHPGAVTTLSPTQDATFKLEAIKCLVAICRSMGVWMNRQLRIPDSHLLKNSEADDCNLDTGNATTAPNGVGEDAVNGEKLHTEINSETSEAATFEQRRAYKLELKEGISLFNRKPSKGIEFLINANKVGGSPEEIATFLKKASGLDQTMIGDYLGQREGFPLRVMHAYVDSFNFEGMEFDEAVRFLLQGFRLPGEAQKIDRIMEKFAECYCKCNPKAFTSADTAYVLAYSVILLNTDAHNPMVKNKMTKADFIRNNRGIDDGKDLLEGYLGSLYDRIVKNEIKMKADTLSFPSKQPTNVNKILGLDSILNIVIRKREEEKPLETSDDLIGHMQEQFKAKTGKSESIYYSATDVEILRFMVEVCWAPMLAAFSVTLDQSEDEFVTFHCLDGFRHAIHITAVMCMQTQRDAFVTSVAKFTSLHSAADIKQKNIDAVKAIISIADEDGNYLQQAWEHILTCLSRFEHLHLLGEGAPPDATFFTIPQNELEKTKQPKSPVLHARKKMGSGHLQHAATAAARRGSYDSAGVGGHASVVTTEQMNNLVCNLNMLEQIDSFEMNRVFTRSQRLNSEAIVDFVKALCKVSMEELRSPTDPRVFSLTKIVEITHYNMNRIRLVWSRIWHVLSDFFVTVGCSENLSVAIFVMDSLRQLAMKFLEREELANYNFQSEFMKPFVIVIRKSSSVEIRELVIRCVSQMVLVRVNNVKSGWKSMFMVFTSAASDDHKNIVLLAFEIIEKIVRDYFSYITETETTTFTDCVNCLIAFTNSRFNKDVSLNAIAFLRFCALKLAEGGLVSSTKNKEKEKFGKSAALSLTDTNDGISYSPKFTDKDDHWFFWFPLLAGLSKLTFDPRPDIRKSALQVLFDTLRHHGHLFSPALWERVFDSVLFPIFDYVQDATGPEDRRAHGNDSEDKDLKENAWIFEMCTLALQLVVDLFVKFYNLVNPLQWKVLKLLTSFIKQPHQSLAGIGVASFIRLMSNVENRFSEDKWQQVLLSLKEAAAETVPDFDQIVYSMDEIEMLGIIEEYPRKYNNGMLADGTMAIKEMEDKGVDLLQLAISHAKCHMEVQLLLIQVIMEIYNMHGGHLSAANTMVLLDILNFLAAHAHQVNSDYALRMKLLEVCSLTQMSDPPLLRVESESYQAYLKLLQHIALDKSNLAKEADIETRLVELCEEVLQVYINTATSESFPEPLSSQSGSHWGIPLGSARRDELASRAPLVVATLQAISGLKDASFERYISQFFPLLANLVSCEHGSGEVQLALRDMFSSWIGPILLKA
eukprot:Gb_26513 [translate_table: standard]